MTPAKGNTQEVKKGEREGQALQESWWEGKPITLITLNSAYHPS